MKIKGEKVPKRRNRIWEQWRGVQIPTPVAIRQEKGKLESSKKPLEKKGGNR